VSDMSAIDAAWLRMDRPTNLAIITSALWFARPIDWEAVEELLRERLLDRFPRFSQRAMEPRIPIGMPRWEDDPRFELRRHVHRVRATPGVVLAAAALRLRLLHSSMTARTRVTGRKPPGLGEYRLRGVRAAPRAGASA